MNQPRITVITPNYNDARHLERAICSVLDQGYENLEFFVIDGGSTDDSVEIIRLYEADLAGWVSEPDAGPAEAINKGLRRATGDIVAYLHSDDVYLPHTLDEVSQRMTAADAPQWVVGQYGRIGLLDDILPETSVAAPDSLAEYLMHDSGYLPGQASFLSRQMVGANGLFDEDMPQGFDYEYWCRLMSAGHQPTVLSHTVTARQESDNKRNSAETLRSGLDYIVAAQRYAYGLPLADRYALWANCDTRRRIYTLAEAETHNSGGRTFIWQQLMKRPWWIANDTVRRALLHGMSHPLPQEAIRPAA